MELPIIKVQTVHKADKSTWTPWALANDMCRLIEGTREAEYAPAVLTTEAEVLVTNGCTSCA